MADFNPDAYLSGKQGFDPDAYLKTPVTGKPLVIGKEGFSQALKETLQEADPVTRNIAAAGTALSNIWEGAKQLIGKGDKQRIEANRIIAEAAPVGALAGNVALLAPTAMIPGANTYAGAGVIGAATGLLQPVMGEESRVQNALLGAGAGVAGKGAGDYLANKLARSGATGLQQQAQNAVRDQTLAAGRQLGYAVPPADINPTLVNQALGGLSGKIKTSQKFSELNQEITNLAAKRTVGIPDDAPLNDAALETIRKEAGKAYQAVADLGEIPVSGKLPVSVKTKEIVDPLAVATGKAKQEVVDSAELVRAWKQANHDAKGYFKAYNRDANPETLAKAKAAESTAKKIDDFLNKSLDEMGASDLSAALKEARVQIAKTYTVERALNPSTGNVDAAVLKRLLEKGGYLSGDLKTSAQMAQAFPKAMQTLKEPAGAVSPLDYGAALVAAPVDLGMSAGVLATRPAVRNLLASRAYQSRFANPSYEPNALLRTLGSPVVTTALPSVSTGAVLGSRP